MRRVLPSQEYTIMLPVGRSENVFQAELKLAHRSGGSNDAERGRAARVGAGRVPVGMVRRIERFESDIERVALVNPYVPR